MSKTGIVLVLTLLVSGAAGMLQRQDATSRRAPPQIDRVALSMSDAGGRLQISGRHAEDCAAPLETVSKVFPKNLDIQTYREIASTAVCGLQETSFEIALAVDAAADAIAIIINDQVWLADGDGFTEANLFPALIEQAAPLPLDGGGLQLRLRGSQAVGCDLPELYTWRETDAGVFLGVYNALDAATVCPDALIEIDETISTPATEMPTDTLFAVNGILVSELETQNVSDTDKVLTNIFRVDATVAGGQISLAIEGEHPDGCDYPVQVDQSRDGNSIQVEVYREVPADVFCPMILQPYKGTINIEGNFAAGDYTIRVNSHSQTVNI